MAAVGRPSPAGGPAGPDRVGEVGPARAALLVVRVTSGNWRRAVAEPSRRSRPTGWAADRFPTGTGRSVATSGISRGPEGGLRDDRFPTALDIRRALYPCGPQRSPRCREIPDRGRAGQGPMRREPAWRLGWRRWFGDHHRSRGGGGRSGARQGPSAVASRRPDERSSDRFSTYRPRAVANRHGGRTSCTRRSPPMFPDTFRPTGPRPAGGRRRPGRRSARETSRGATTVRPVPRLSSYLGNHFGDCLTNRRRIAAEGARSVHAPNEGTRENGRGTVRQPSRRSRETRDGSSRHADRPATWSTCSTDGEARSPTADVT